MIMIRDIKFVFFLIRTLFVKFEFYSSYVLNVCKSNSNLNCKTKFELRLTSLVMMTIIIVIIIIIYVDCGCSGLNRCQ